MAAETKAQRIFLKRLGYGSEHVRVSSILPNFLPTQGVEDGGVLQDWSCAISLHSFPSHPPTGLPLTPTCGQRKEIDVVVDVN